MNIKGRGEGVVESEGREGWGVMEGGRVREEGGALKGGKVMKGGGSGVE